MWRKSSRRIKLLVLSLLLPATVLSAWAFWWEPASLRLSEECIAVKWTPGRPVRIAVLTDLHVGSPFNGLDKLRDIVARTNAADPDVITILGDFVIQGVLGGSFVPPEDIARELAHLKAPAGVLSVLGNHDAWLDAARVQKAIESAGIQVLEDRAVRVETPAGAMWFAGVSDFWTRPHDVRAALSSIPDTREPIIVLTHNPDIFPDIPGHATLTLAGHTHGGQVRLPLLGRPIVPSDYGQRFAAGHIVEGGRRLYVATGTGMSILPVRFRVPPSIVVLTVGAAC